MSDSFLVLWDTTGSTAAILLTLPDRYTNLPSEVVSFNGHKSECIHPFDELKSQLLSAPILSFPDFEKPFILDTDACQYGIGAVLSQDHDGEEKVVAYGSRTLSKAERKYCVTRKELLAVVTFTKHFRPYLLGRHFTLRTDHSSLQWLYKMVRAAPRV